MKLHSVSLQSFKVYKDAIAGPFDDGVSTIVGPNGCGKSCLIEAICFALGASSSGGVPLSQLVHRGSPGGNAAVAVCFRSSEVGSHRLVVQRRIIGGRRAEWSLQHCRCGKDATTGTADGVDERSKAKACVLCPSCAVDRMVKRDELREALKANARFDIERPERWVVHQATALAVAQKAPPELLRFLEGVVGTESLREGVQREAARSHELHSSLRSLLERIAAERMLVDRHAPAMLEFRKVEERRSSLEALKLLHLKRELAFYNAARHKTEAASGGHDDTVAGLRHERDAHQAHLSQITSCTKANDVALAKARTALALAERSVGRHRDAHTKLSLERKQHASAESRASRAAATLRTRLVATHDDERAAQMAQAETQSAERLVRERLELTMAALKAREAAMTAMEEEEVEARECEEPEEPENQEKQGADDAQRTEETSATAVERRLLRLEAALRRLVSSRDAGSVLASHHAAAERKRSGEERKRRAAAEVARLRGARAEAIDAVRSAQQSLDQTTKTMQEAMGRQEREESLRTSKEREAAGMLAKLASLNAQLAEQQKQLESTSAVASIDGRIAAVKHLRTQSEGGPFTARIHGYLCELMTTSAAHATAVNAALGAALHSSVVVQDRATALSVVEHFSCSSLGTVTCLILDELDLPKADTHAPMGCMPLERCVNCEVRFRPLVSRLLRKWALAPNSAVALSATFSSADRQGRGGGGAHQHVVTLQGECFMSTGEIQQVARRSSDGFALSPFLQHLSGMDGGVGGRSGDEATGRAAESRHAATIEREVASLLALVDSMSMEAAALRSQAAQHGMAASDASELASLSSQALKRETELLEAAECELVQTEAKLSDKLDALNQLLGGTGGDRSGSGGLAAVADGDGSGGANGRVERLRLECERRRADLGARSASAQDAVSPFSNPAASPSADATDAASACATELSTTLLSSGEIDMSRVSWHRLHELAGKLGAQAEELSEAIDRSRRRSKAAVAARRSLEAKERTLSTQVATARRASEATTAKAGALEAKLRAATSVVEQSVAEKDRLIAEASSLAAQKEDATEALALARIALRRAELEANEVHKRLQAQRAAVQLLDEQLRDAGALSDGAEEDTRSAVQGHRGMDPERRKRRKLSDGSNGDNDDDDRDRHNDDTDDDEGAAMAREHNGENDDETMENERGARTCRTKGEEAPSESEINAYRLELRAEERIFLARQRALDVNSLEAYLAASSAVAALVSDADQLRSDAAQSAKRVETLQAERSRLLLVGLRAIDAGLRETFRSLCRHGDCALEFASEPAVLLAEGVGIAVRPARAEWTRFEQLSGGQQALVAVALNLSLHEADGAPFCLFDEIDAALDSQRVHALAAHVRARKSSQSVFVSHRRELIEASRRLLGVYTRGDGSHTVSVGFSAAA